MPVTFPVGTSTKAVRKRHRRIAMLVFMVGKVLFTDWMQPCGEFHKSF
jgi:hypothetical protein